MRLTADNRIVCHHDKDTSRTTGQPKLISETTLQDLKSLECGSWLGKQWSNNKLLTSLSEKQEVLGCIRRDKFITILYKQTSNILPGEFLGRLVLGLEGDMIKVFGATIY